MDRGESTERGPPPLKPPPRVLKVNRASPAAKFNSKLMRTLESSLRENPETDLLSIFPSSYVKDLVQLSTTNPRVAKHVKRPAPTPRDTRSLLKPTDEPIVISPLSDEVQALLNQILAEEVSGDEDQEENDEEADAQDEDVKERSENGGFTEAILEPLDRSEVIFQYAFGFSNMVLRISDNIVAKVIREVDNITEHSSLEYLRDNAPDIPVPRPLGMIQMGHYLLLFSSYVPGEDLDKVWPRLDESQKQSISMQIDDISTKLRAIPYPLGKALGGVNSECCKDARRSIRRNAQPVLSLKDFEDHGVKCVFTHGDLRTANIRVMKADDGWRITCIIDWDFSGFYPGYWESFKITNTMMAFEDSDWYQHLPRSLSPLNFANRWLLDRIWDRLVA
ncbi:kinase-like domain-containing protein [Phialemonium atrogriseum]|uniref:Kinase-like domain-containing protein n=1 Tax=Phialemonium atrogriseum TaxID=1093897 RepID=A0AAJ0FET8_9PEZI|nr:kinase-like domain-containing protein [Phialemonium atrogriseum]KAK1764727.1 kinase-like domain-containing protein [Phialemonium atrogriseum]